MSSKDNPYEVPKSTALEEHDAGSLQDPRAVPAGRAIDWIGQGFSLFQMSPGAWIGILVILFVINVIVGLAPGVNILISVIQPLFSAGIAYGCYQLDTENKLAVEDLFAGFKNNPGPLLAIGAISLGVTVIVFFGAGILGAATFMTLASDPVLPTDPQGLIWLLLIALVALGLLIPLWMATWFSPTLVILHDTPAIEAMKLSFEACLKNILPFSIYGLLGLVMLTIAATPLMLGLLVALPILMASNYCSYKDIFLHQD